MLARLESKSERKHFHCSCSVGQPLNGSSTIERSNSVCRVVTGTVVVTFISQRIEGQKKPHVGVDRTMVGCSPTTTMAR